MYAIRSYYELVGGKILGEEPARLVRPELGVETVRGEQLGVRSLLDDASGFEHHEPVHARHRRQAVRDRDYA